MKLQLSLCHNRASAFLFHELLFLTDLLDGEYLLSTCFALREKRFGFAFLGVWVADCFGFAAPVFFAIFSLSLRETFYHSLFCIQDLFWDWNIIGNVIVEIWVFLFVYLFEF